jgi:CheY-like chemotaxis protein
MGSPEDTLNEKKILIVDDDARNIFALSSYLEAIGMHIHTAGNGFEAIDFLKGGQATDIVLMDMMMPEMDGFEAIGKIRADKSINFIPIIAVTAKAMKGDREKCLAAGANEYVSKPVNLQELLEKMATFL